MWEFVGVGAEEVQPSLDGGVLFAGEESGGGVALEIDWQAEWELPDIFTGTNALEVSLGFDLAHPSTNPATETYAIASLPEDLSHVLLVEVNGAIYTASVDPANPRSQEFTRASDGAIVLAGVSRQAVGATVRVVGRGVGIGGGGIPSTALAAGILPPLLRGLPLLGEFSWELGLEDHPSATFNLVATYQTVGAIRSAFKRGSEYEIFGIGFRVQSVAESQGNLGQAAGGVYFFSIRLDGKWKLLLEKKPVYLRRQGTGANPPAGAVPNYTSSNQAYQDSDCQVAPPGTAIVANSSTATTIAKQFTSVQELGSQIGVKIAGPPMPVEIPPDTQPDTSENLGPMLEERLRIAGCFADYSSATEVRAMRWGEGRTWSFAAPQLFPLSEQEGIKIYLSHDYRDEGQPAVGVGGGATFAIASSFPSAIASPPIFSPSPESSIGYGAAIAPTRLEWGSNSSDETKKKPSQYSYTSSGGKEEPTNNSKRPRFKRRGRVEKTYTEGDTENLGSPPPEISLVYGTLDLLWTKSGPTKTEIEHTTIDGMPKRDRVSTWGVIGTAKAGLSWAEVKREATEHHYDDRTGYYLGSTTSGFQWVQILQESLQNPETCKLDAADPKFDLYAFRAIAIAGRTNKVLHQYRDYYSDARNSESPLFDLFKTCNRDGSSSIVPIYNPNFVSGMFEVEEGTKRSAFAFVHNPDYDPVDPEKNKLPKYLTTGEDGNNRIKRTILPAAKNALARLGEFKDISIAAQPNAVDSYSEYRSDFSSSGALFSDGAESTGTSVNQGRPSPATRLPDLYELEESEVESGNPSEASSASNTATVSQIQSDGSRTEKIVCTVPHALSEPVSGSKSYSLAFSYQEALQAFKTEAVLSDARQTVSTNLSVPLNSAIRPGDKATIAYGSDSYKRVILSVSGKISFLGITESGLTCAWQPMAIAAGIDRDIQILEKTSITPQPKDPAQYQNQDPEKTNKNRPQEVEIFFVVTNNLELGERLPYSSARYIQNG
ncbi:MAG TPA: hypothetical protein DD990_32710 [Cyanobacteria bacterium UBA11368]|nr:hypothetical protein [Cyanobacteria bacterium UBA11368]